MDNDQNIEKEIEVKQFIIDNTWNELKLKENISEEMVNYIVNNISPVLTNADNDSPWWMGSTSGDFTVRSAWEDIRKKRARQNAIRIYGTRDFL